MAERSSLQHVDDLTAPPIVGQRYRVPTVRWEIEGILATWPVRGARHEDAEYLRFKPQHFHIDARFVTGRARAALMRRYARHEGAKGLDADGLLDLAVGGIVLQERREVGLLLPEPIERRLICHRAEQGHPTAFSLTYPAFRNLHAAYEGKRCGRNAAGMLVCPHKGAALGGLAPDENGRVVCPLHGLAIDTRDGRVVRAMPEVRHG